MYTEEQLERLYMDSLDEIGRNGIENYGSLLKESDETAFNCGFSDFIDDYTQCIICDNYFDKDEIDGNCCLDCEDKRNL
jgi:hypothetical protein